MRISNQIHLIRKEFYVTPEVKRYINIYLIVGEHCYLVDCGVAGAHILIENYLQSINRKITDIKGIFLTHSHPDHMGAAAEIQKRTNCKIYAPIEEVSWIEDIQKQFKERPIPNFFKLLPESVKVNQQLRDGDVITLEGGMRIEALATKGHSHGSMSYIFNENIVFTGDAIPVENDLPIFIDYEQIIKSLDRLHSIPGIDFYCPAWDDIYDKDKYDMVMKKSKKMLARLVDVVAQVEKQMPHTAESEKLHEIYKRADMIKMLGNPLVEKSIDACRSYINHSKV